MKKIGYIWTVIIGLFEVFVSIAIFSSIYGSFEKIVVALLLIIYATIRTIGAGLGQGVMSMAIVNHAEFRSIKNLINPASDEDEEYYQEQRKGALEKQKNIQTKFIINSISILIIYVMSVLVLLGAL